MHKKSVSQMCIKNNAQEDAQRCTQMCMFVCVCVEETQTNMCKTYTFAKVTQTHRIKSVCLCEQRRTHCSWATNKTMAIDVSFEWVDVNWVDANQVGVFV